MKPFDANGKFLPIEEGVELRHIAVRAAGITVFSQGFLFCLQMMATMILARILTPADFGVVTMVTTFSLLLTSFGLNGFTEAVLQKESIEQALASNLFWINVSAGTLLTVAFASAGSLLARVYGDPRVAHVAVGMSPTIFITCISVLHLALLKRAMRFLALSANDILARTVSIITAILLGRFGWGYWALVAGAVTLPLMTSIGAWVLCRWVPRLPQRATGTTTTVWYAVRVYAKFTLSYFGGNTDNVLVGWRFGAESLGFYKKAFDLFFLPVSQLLSPVASVAISSLSRVSGDSVRYKRYFVSALSVLAFIGMGAGADFMLVGKDIIRLVLGPGWEVSGHIFMFFGAGVGVMLLYNTHTFIHLSIGTPERLFRWGIIELAVTVLLFVIALPWGPVGIATAWTASFWILAVPAFWYAGRPIHFGIVPVLAAVWKYLLASLLAGCTCAVIIREIDSLVAASGAVGAMARIATTSLLFGALYVGAVVLLHRGFGPLHHFGGLLREMVPWYRVSRLSSLVYAPSATDGTAVPPPNRSGEAS